MRRSIIGILFIGATAVCLTLPSTACAQEAVSTTSSSAGTSTSSTATGSAGTTTNLATGSGAPSGAVTGSGTNTPTLERNPSGTGVFSPTPVKLYLSLFGGYDDNVNTSAGPKESSAFVGGNIVLDYTFGEPRLQIALNLGAGGDYYLQNVTGQDYDIDLKAALGVTYRANPRLTLGATVLLDYLTQPSFDNPGGLNSRNGNYFYTTDNFFVGYIWSRRFSTKTSYAFEAYNFDNEAVALFSNRVTNTFGNQFLFQMVPTTQLVVEYRYGIVTYQDDTTLDSGTHYVLGGIDHQFNPRFSGTFRGGAEFRSYNNGEDRTGPYFEGALNYAVGRRTSVGWTGRYGIEEPDTPGEQSRTVFRTGLHAKFDFTSRVSTTLDGTYAHEDYHSLTTALVPVAPFTEESFDIGLSLRYAITPLIGVQASYHYTDVISDVASREYSRNRVSGGVNFTF